MSASGKRTGLIAAGLMVLVVGMLAAVTLWYLGASRRSDAVRGFARAPVGCDTTLEFDRTGRFLVFLETEGTLVDLDGNCDPDEQVERNAESLPAVRLTLRDDAGDEVDLDSRPGVDYDTDGFVGTSIREFEVDEAGEYVLRVESTTGDRDFAVAVGGDPSAGVDGLRLGAAAAAIAALVIGGLLLVLGARRPDAIAEPAATGWPDTPTAWPTAPPTMSPPTMSPPNVAPPAHSGTSLPPPPAAWPPQAPAGPPIAPPPPPSGNVAPPPAWHPDRPQPTERPAADGNSGDGERSPWAPPGSGTP